jgi:peptidoglycan hydrolase CwlO-like protein
MKKLLAAILLTITIVVAGVMTVHADHIFYKEKLADMIRKLEDVFYDRKEAITELLIDRQEERLKRITDELANVKNDVADSMTGEVMAYKGRYQMELLEKEESMILHTPFEVYAEDKTSEIHLSIEEEMEEYLRKRLGIE